MIILPDKNIPRSRFLMPMSNKYWRTPSHAQQKDQFGNENFTRFRLRARVDDGHIVWEGWFDDRDDLDAFLWAIASETLIYEKELWELPSPEWTPDIGENIVYDFYSISYFGSPVNSLGTYTKPKDFNSGRNRITCLGGGGSGAAYFRDAGEIRKAATGGGGGGCGQYANINIADDFTYYQVGGGGPGGSDSGSGNGGFTGQAGGASFFGNTTYSGSPVGGTGGGGGTFINNSTRPGGTAGSWKGTSGFNGGRGGDVYYNSGSGYHATGGGGAAGWEAAGTNGVDISTNVSSSNGGFGNGGINGGGVPNSGNGTNFGSGIGSGAGGIGVVATSGPGGFYGGGSGASLRGGGTAISSSGAQGLVIVEYTPISFLSKSPIIGS